VPLKKLLKKYRIKLKHFYHQKRLKHHDFSIISNNCWGTRTYQKFGLQYMSPFQSLFIPAPDYIRLIENFSIEKLQIKEFISKEESKYFDFISTGELATLHYPIARLIDNIEIHFQHYKTQEDAQIKWEKRCKRLNTDKLLFKFCDGYLANDFLIEKFDKLPHKNKICFTAKKYKHLPSVVYMKHFKNDKYVSLEWKYDKKYIDIHKLFNDIK
jgi:uncharacterized protein (DUF1919 family)